jgi:hypothetical protein
LDRNETDRKTFEKRPPIFFKETNPKKSFPRPKVLRILRISDKKTKVTTTLTFFDHEPIRRRSSGLLPKTPLVLRCVFFLFRHSYDSFLRFGESWKSNAPYGAKFSHGALRHTIIGGKL